MKKLVAFLLTLTLLLSLCSVSAFAVAGDGSAQNPYLVASEADLTTAIKLASGENNHIKLTDDIVLNNWIFIRQSVDIDFDKNTIECGQDGKFDISSTDGVVLRNGIINGESVYLLSIYGVENITVRNIEIYTTGLYTVSVTNSSVSFENCRVQSTASNGMAVRLSITGIYDEDAEFNVTAENCDFMGGNLAYSVSNQQEVHDPNFGIYQPKVNYHFTLNGEVVSDENSDSHISAENAEITGNYSDEWKADMRVTQFTYNVAPDYTVTIPESVTLGDTVAVSVENVMLEKGKQVQVSLAGTSGDSDAFTLKSAEGVLIEYTVQNGQTSINVGDTLLTVNPDHGTAGRTELDFTAPDSTQFAGEYTGTITFTVSVVEVTGA